MNSGFEDLDNSEESKYEKSNYISSGFKINLYL